MPAEGRENPLLKKGNSDAFFREKYLTKNRLRWALWSAGYYRCHGSDRSGWHHRGNRSGW